MRSNYFLHYLAPWSQWVTDAAGILKLVQVLSPLYSAVTYHQVILPGMEIRWEMENMLAYYLRSLLEAFAT